MSRALMAVCALLSLAGCGPEARWERVHSELTEGLVAVWGRSSAEVYAVGGDSGEGPIVLRFDGASWTRLRTGASGDLWWIHGVLPSGPIFFGGSGGLMLRYEGAAFELMDTPGTGTVFGVWAASADDVWAVGGVGASAGFVWRYDGNAWNEVALPELGDRAIFKVWGLGPDDVWMVGAAGAMYHFDGSSVAPVDAGTTRTLFTVHALGDRVVAVGGAGTAALVEREGAAFVDRSPELVPGLFGVWLTPDGSGWAVGTNGTILRRSASEWVADETDIGFVHALHAVWVDETGGAWAVGGQVISSPLSRGVLLHRGAPIAGGPIVNE